MKTLKIKKVSGTTVKILLAFLIIPVFICTANAAEAAISTYADSDLSEPATVFGAGAKVYVTVTDGATTGGNNAVITVTNSNENPAEMVTVEISDDGKFYDETADDGVFSGMFIVTTMLTIEPSRAPSPEDVEYGICYKIVKNIRIDDRDTVLIEADLDEDGTKESKAVSLVTLFDLMAAAVKDTSATIYWNTADSGYSKVDYGTTPTYDRTALLSELHITHRITLDGLDPDTTYHYKVTTVDNYGKSRSSDDRTFKTLTTEALENIIKAARDAGDLPHEYYVSTSGDDSYDGLSQTHTSGENGPWATPSHAVRQAEAGDTIYLIKGTWNDEHLIFANSGIGVAPITLTNLGNEMSTLDGGDKTGYAIRLRDGKSCLNISGLHIKNYSNGFYIQDKIDNVNIHNFIIENTGHSAVTFATSDRKSNIFFRDFEIYETGGSEGYTTVSYGNGRNFSNIELYDFHIHDTTGDSIMFRHVDRLYVGSGRIINSGHDALSFSLSTYNSIMENLVVDHTGWHGVAIHDWTVGKYPCFNNTIRNCDISYIDHNHIDLHSGTYNTLVEKNVLHEEVSYCSGIYFHNRGNGLIARYNEIFNMHKGINGGGFKEFPMRNMIVEYNTVHDCEQGLSQSAHNVSISHNHFYNNEYQLSLSGTDMLFDNNINGDYTYRLDHGKGIVRNPRDETYRIRSARGSNVTLEYTDCRVYTQELTYHSGPYTLSEAVWTLGRSCTTMKTTSGENGIILAITAYPMTAVPASDNATITVAKFDTTPRRRRARNAHRGRQRQHPVRQCGVAVRIHLHRNADHDQNRHADRDRHGNGYRQSDRGRGDNRRDFVRRDR
jgi:hypothetical protein